MRYRNDKIAEILTVGRRLILVCVTISKRFGSSFKGIIYGVVREFFFDTFSYFSKYLKKVLRSLKSGP